MTFVRFADVRGHERPLGVLRRSVASGRLHHAYLFQGPEGVGKRRVADALAALVYCESPTGVGAALDACGECAACAKVAAESHPDRIVVEPDGRFIKIDQVRAIHAQTRFRPYEGERRVVIIERADVLHEAAANALLKTLEEPRGDTMFVLITANPQKLLTTIVSRCQPLRFGSLPPDDLAEILAQHGIDRAAAEVAARLGGGSVGGALHVLESSAWEGRPELAARLGNLARASSAEIVGWAADLGGSGSDVRDVLAITRTLYRDASLDAAGASRDRLVNSDIVDAVASIAAGRTALQLAAAVQRVEEAEKMLDGNVNPRMVCETLLLTLSSDPTRTLAQRLPA